MYHAWGLGMSILAISLGSTMVVHRRFDPGVTLSALAQHRCTALVVVPVLLNRLVSLGQDRIDAADLSALRIIASSGAQLDGALGTRAMDACGDVVYNLYGSTEVAWATIATPADLRDAPGCAGKPPLEPRFASWTTGTTGTRRDHRAGLHRQRDGVQRLHRREHPRR